MKVLSQSKLQVYTVIAFALSMVASTIPSFMGLMVDVERFAFPINVIIAMTVLVLACLCRPVAKWKMLKWTIVIASLLFVLVLGFSSQEVVRSIVHSWTFVCLLLWILFLLVVNIMGSERSVFLSKITLAGLWLVLISLTFGECDSTRGSIVVRSVGPDNLLICNDSHSVLPYTYQLVSADNEKADISFVADGDTSTIVLQNGKSASFGCYDFTLKSVDVSQPPRFVVADVYWQPWKYVVYVGVGLIVVGLFVSLLKKQKLC